jgi:hypothetical protein
MSDAEYDDGRWGRQCDRCGVVLYRITSTGRPASPRVARLANGWLTDGDYDECPMCLRAPKFSDEDDWWSHW